MSLDETEFWKQLERRVCAEFAGLDDQHARHLWCDGFVPEEYVLQGKPPLIRGSVWIGDPQCLWQFTLLLPQTISDPAHLDWSILLPSADVTAWLTPERDAHRLTIEPGGAVPDGS